MKTMILAAGRGERMRPLTEHTPKPMLRCGKEPLIGHHLRHLAAAGLSEIVINHAYLGEQIEAGLGDGTDWGVAIRYSPECSGGLETAGGIATALPLLGSAPFLVINGDVYTDFSFSEALVVAQSLAADTLAHLWLVPNPAHNPNGDFHLDAVGKIHSEHDQAPRYTFSGIGIYRPELFVNTSAHKPAKLAPLLRKAMREGRVTGALFEGVWLDVGTPERLEQAAKLSEQSAY